MEAIITGKSELRLSDLTREYVFDILHEDKIILSSQVIRSRPVEVVDQIRQVVSEYEAVYLADDVEVGQVV